MKSLLTLISVLIIFFTSGVIAGVGTDIKVEKLKKSGVPKALFIWGHPEEDAPEELRNVKAKTALVPLAPKVLGDADFDFVEVREINTGYSVPLPPFNWGDPQQIIELIN